MGRKLRDAIREAIEEELAEMTATGGVAGFGTPHAFSTAEPVSSGKKKKKKGINEAGDPYWAYRNDETQSPRMKMGRAIQEVNKQLNVIERTLKMNSRLKKETGLPSSNYWGRTNKALVKIEQRMHRIAKMVREIRV